MVFDTNGEQPLSAMISMVTKVGPWGACGICVPSLCLPRLLQSAGTWGEQGVGTWGLLNKRALR